MIMGITFLAAGTSVPDCMASLIVARQGVQVFIFTLISRFIVKNLAKKNKKSLIVQGQINPQDVNK